jgi:GTP-binding protein
VSHTPGATKQINFFSLRDVCVLVDLPGYGYARASKSLAAEWQRLIFAYLRGRANLARTLLLIDARRGIMPPDRDVMQLLDEAAVSYAGVLTKIDELSAAELREVQSLTQEELARRAAAHPQLFETSAHASRGLDPLKDQIAALVEAWGNKV